MMITILVNVMMIRYDGDDIAERKLSVSHLLAQNRVVISVKAPIGVTLLLLLGE